MQRIISLYEGDCFREGTLIALEEGEISYHDYLQMVEHCKQCKECSNRMAETEQNIRKVKPYLPSIFALNSPKRGGCFSLDEIANIKTKERIIGGLQFEFFITHCCTCPRCYLISYHLNDFVIDQDEGGTIYVCIPFRVLDDIMIREIVGEKNYETIKYEVMKEAQSEGYDEILYNNICDYYFFMDRMDKRALLLECVKKNSGDYCVLSTDTVEYFEGNNFEELFSCY